MREMHSHGISVMEFMTCGHDPEVLLTWDRDAKVLFDCTCTARMNLRPDGSWSHAASWQQAA